MKKTELKQQNQDLLIENTLIKGQLQGINTLTEVLIKTIEKHTSNESIEQKINNRIFELDENIKKIRKSSRFYRLSILMHQRVIQELKSLLS